MVDIVTVVFDEELAVLRSQAQSINRYFTKFDTQCIYVIVNDRDDVAKQIDPSWWGDLAPCVKIVPRSWFSTQYVENGWVSQQALKLMGVALSNAEWCMIMDAKTILVRESTSMFDQHGRANTGVIPLYSVFEPSKKIVGQLYNIDLPHQLGPGGVPFLIKPRAARHLIADVEHRTGESFPMWFQSQGMLTEFVLFSGYLYAQPGGLESMYNVDNCQIPVCNICHSQVESFDRTFRTAFDALTVSVHRKAWTQLTEDQKNYFTGFLRSRGIDL